MQKYLLLLFLFICASCIGSKNGILEQNKTFDIIIDPDRFTDDLDLSCILTDSIEIIKLETSDECLIGEIKKVSFTDQFIFVSDPYVSQKIFMFDKNGKFVKSIGSQGGGPGEYSTISNFTITGDSLLIQDYNLHKYLVYSIKENRFVGDIRYEPHHHSIVAYPDILYFVSGYFPADSGCYNLYRLDLRNSSMESYLPFSLKIAVNRSAWSIEEQCSRVCERSFIFYALSDTIYQVNKDKAIPVYTLKFSKRSIPDDFKESHSGDEIMDLAFQEGYVRGPIHLQHSDQWMLGTYVDGKEYRYMLVDKKTGQYQIGRQLGVRKEGNLTIPHNFLIEDNYFISWLPVKLLNLWKNHFSPNTFRDKGRVETWKRLIDSLDIDDNPVLIKCKIRNDET